MKKIGYRAYKALRDDNGNIVHMTLIGFASKSDAVDVAERYDWCLVDKNGFEYELKIEEM